MAKVLLVNGSPNEFGCTYTALKELKMKLEQHGIEGEIFWLGKGPISGCTACRACYSLDRCVIDDYVNQIADRLDEYAGCVDEVHYEESNCKNLYVAQDNHKTVD